jgi:integrase
MRRDLNDAWLRTVKPPASGRLELRDARVVGLVLRIGPLRKDQAGRPLPATGTWSVRTRTADGKQTRPKLGTWPAMGIGDARKGALAALAAVQAGADPVRQKREAREARKARAAEASVADRIAEWQAQRAAAVTRRWSPRYIADVKRLVSVEIVPRIGKKKLAATTRADWTGMVAAKRKSAPVVAAALYRVVSSFLNHAEVEGWIPGPLLPRKGAARIAPPPPPRERVLTDEELAAIWRAGEREAPKLRAFMRLLILTAARELEVADIGAGEVDLEAGRWTIPGGRTKNGLGYLVPLSPLALAELRAVWPVDREAAPEELLLGRTTRNGFRGFSRLKARVDAASGVTGWRWHDLRRTARTGMTRLGVPRDHAEAAINHISGRSALERTYDRHDFAPEALAALALWQGHVAGLVGRAAEVVALAERRRPAGGK